MINTVRIEQNEVTMEWFNEFKDVIYNTKGNIIGARINESYFSKQGKISLWESFTSATAHLNYLIDHRKIIHFLNAGYFTEANIPKCHCGNNVKWLNGKISESCSQICALNSPTRIAKLKHSISKSDKVGAKKKREETMLEKYGAAFNSQREDIHHRWTKTKLDEKIYSKLSNYDWMDVEYNQNQRTAVDIAKEVGCYYSTVLWYCNLHGFKIRKRSSYSLTEKEIISFIESLGVPCIHSDWDTLAKLEIDVLVPEHNLAIEIDGLYWHSLSKGEETKENRNRHKHKTLELRKLGIQLLHITDEEWCNKQEIIKDIIRSKLGKNEKLPGRKCKVEMVPQKMVKEFLMENHVQGFSVSKLNYGLFFGGELVMLATFGRPRFNKNYDFELIRLSSKLGVTVIGGFSKLLSAFRKEINGSLLSYCDIRFSSGESYKKCGFVLVGESEPGYFWNDGTHVLNRYKTQKQNLKKWLKGFDCTLSESENMFNAGYRRYWDCGQLTFVFS